jgi:diguanylate cyclase (GGDEF)-like protein/PAS domain S-box-containing protein
MPRGNRRAARNGSRVERASGMHPIDSAPIGLALIDPEGRFLQVNSRLCSLLGYTEQQMLRGTLGGLTDPHDQDPLAAHCRSLLAGEVDEFRLEQRFLRADGHPTWGQIHATRVTGERQQSFACVITIDEGPEHRLSGLSRALSFAVIRALTEAPTADAVPRSILQNLCETGTWARGEIWIVDVRLKVLRLLDTWPPPAAEPVEREPMSGTTCLPGIGLAGHVWTDGKPVWVTDLASDPVVSRFAAATPPALRSAIAFPILNGRDVTGVAALFSRDIRPPDDGLLGLVIDIGRQIGQVIERKRVEDALQKSVEDIHAVLDNVADGVMTTDERGFIESFNRAAQRLFGYPTGEVLGREAKLLMAEPYQGEFTGFLTSHMRPGRDPASTSGSREMWGRRKDGSTFPIEFRATEMLLSGERRFVGILRDISDERAQREALEYQALHDVLTGLPNRTLLNDRLRQAILTGQRERKSITLLVMDMNGFKEVNDTLGHDVGDQLLQQVALRLESLLRGSDTMARLGGDEFAVLPSGETGSEGGVVTAKKILAALERPFTIADRSINTSASIGIAVHPDHGQDAQTLLRHADVAMYIAKRARRGYAVYAPRQDGHDAARLELTGELRHAIGHEELVLHFQPKIDLRIGKTIGVEALVRWRHPKRGLMPPDQFIPAAEETELIRPLTRWVLNRAVRQCRLWLESGLEVDVAVNLSAQNLLEADLPAAIKDLLDTWRVDPGRLKVELTESSLMAASAIEALMHLGEMGVDLALDDFGTGFSSLSHLKRLPVREIKIDKSFTAGMLGQEGASLVRPIVELGHTMGLKVVAEGVEDQRTLEGLQALGCDSAQGFYLCAPILAADLTTWMQQSAWGLAARNATDL